MTRTRKTGKRYPLLLYRRIMERLWAPTMLLGVLLLILWGWGWYFELPLVATKNSLWLLGAAGVLLAFSLFTFLARRMAYVQPRQDHFRLVTPFLNLKVSYRRVRSVHSADFQQLFPPVEASWAERRVLEPFYGKTAVVIELNEYPLPRSVLRFFLAPQMFSRRTSAFVLLVPDWLSFSTELDSFFGTWLQPQARQRYSSGQRR